MSTLETSSLVKFITVTVGSVLAMVEVGCQVGPRYTRPAIQAPSAYKEVASEESAIGAQWSAAIPADAAAKGRWWEIFGDSELNNLETEVTISNQNIATAAANYSAARAIVREARSHYFPSLTAGASINYSRVSVFPVANINSGTTYTEYQMPVQASWEPDLWGAVRSSVHSSEFAAQANAAILENVQLAARAQVAMDYYLLRGQDSLATVLNDAVISDQQTLDLTRALYHAGLTTDEAVSAAEAQLSAVQAQRDNVHIARAQYEHAIAALLGKAPADLSIAPTTRETHPPDVPVGIPGDLLQRRPDIASSERAVAAANAEIGVAKAAYFPSILLSGTVGFTGLSAADWFTWPSRMWAVGPSIAQPIFDAGLRRATVQQYRSQYDAAVASYRQTTLTAFQQVEDSLAASHTLKGVLEKQSQAVIAAQRTFDEATVRYKAGLDPYLNVIQAQQTLLTYREVEVEIHSQQMTATVQLIQVLGGGWSDQQMPTSKDVSH